MNIEEIRDYILSLYSVEECFPFGEENFVFKIGGKIFAIMDIESKSINLKCDPEKAIELREHYDFISPGYHMNKKHWNTIDLNSFVENHLLKTWIEDSYKIIIAGLPKKQRELLL